MATKASRQRVGGPYTGPYGATPVTHVSYSEARHLHPERLPSARREKAVSIRLMDVSKETIVNVQKLSATVKRLMAANLKLKNVPEDIVATLVNLTKLDLGSNQLGDTSFPDAMKKLENLLEIRLNHNHLTRVPACLKKLRNLSRLDMSDNKLELTTGLDKLRKLQILVLDNNRLTSVFKDIANLRRLEVFRCSGNSLREIPRDIRQLKSLVDLDVSDNKISILPTDVFTLPRLDVFNCSQNEVSKVPTFNIRPQNKHWISTIDMSDNKLTTFPGHLLLMSSKLDLSGNRLRTIPYNTVKKLDLNTRQELLLDVNPLCYPPPDVCESGLRNLISFFHESQSEVKVYQGVKVLVVGSYRSGKTSLVQTMVDQQPRMSEEIQDTSSGIDTYELAFDLEEGDDLPEGRPGKTLQLNVWDFCGHPFYLYPHYIFFEQPTITILTFSMPDYSSDKFEEQIGAWFDWMIAKTNKLVVILVGTQSDRISKKEVASIAREVRTKLAQHIQRQTDMAKRRIRIIEEQPHISPTLSEQLKAYMKLLQAKFTVQTDVITTSARQLKGLDTLRKAIEALAADRILFPNVMRVIPTFWVDVENYIEERGNAMTIPVMDWDDFVEDVTSRFGMKHLMKAIAQYLHETGKVLWFSESESLKKHVFVRPSWLFDVFRLLLRHDLEDATFNPDEPLKAAGLNVAKFERLKQEYISEGVLDRDLVRCLLASLIPADLVTPASHVLRLLAEGFELGYHISKRQRDSVLTLVPEKDAEGKPKLAKLLIPWLRRNDQPEDFTRSWTEMEGHRKLASFFRFPHYLPPGLFDITTVRAHADKHNLRFLHHWGGGVHAVHAKERVHLVISFFEDSAGDGKGREEAGTMLKYELRDASDDEAELTPAATMWTILLPLLMDFEELLTSYSGLLVERLTECPLCREPSFIGEWLTPKETQSLATRPCQRCGLPVDTAFLVQPREKKRDDILRDVMRKARRRRGAAVSNELQEITRMAPANPDKVKVACPELDVEEGLLGLMGNINRSNSVVADLDAISSRACDVTSVTGSLPQKGGFIPDGVDIDQMGLLREIRKRSSQMTVSDGEEPEADFFVTHADDGGAGGGGGGEGGGEGGGSNDVDEMVQDSESRQPEIRLGLPGLAEFQRRLGIKPSFSSRLSDHDEEREEDDEEEEEEEEQR